MCPYCFSYPGVNISHFLRQRGGKHPTERHTRAQTRGAALAVYDSGVITLWVWRISRGYPTPPPGYEVENDEAVQDSITLEPPSKCVMPIISYRACITFGTVFQPGFQLK